MAASIYSDVVCELGEGPTYDRRRNTLFWFDIVGKKLLEKRWPDGDTVVHDLPFMASALAAIDDHRQLVAAEDGLYIRDVASGRLTLHKPLEADMPANRSNDARVHPCGAFWIGTMRKDEAAAEGSIYWYFRGEMRRLYGSIKVPNSICFSADGTIAYFIDTGTKSLKRVACDPDTGLPTADPVEFVRGGDDGWIDGSVCDADGVIWNAKWGGSRVDAYSPDGTLIRSVAVPALKSSCPAFVGPDASRMICTSAAIEIDRTQDRTAGKTYLLDVAVRGRFDPDVAL